MHDRLYSCAYKGKIRMSQGLGNQRDKIRLSVCEISNGQDRYAYRIKKKITVINLFRNIQIRYQLHFIYRTFENVLIVLFLPNEIITGRVIRLKLNGV